MIAYVKCLYMYYISLYIMYTFQVFCLLYIKNVYVCALDSWVIFLHYNQIPFLLFVIF